MRRPLVLPLQVLVPVLCLIGACPLIAQDPPPPPPVVDTAPLLIAAQEALSVLDKAVSFETTQGDLAARVTVFPDAWHYHALTLLVQELAAGRTVEATVEKLAEDTTVRRKLSGKPAFRLTLKHPGVTTGIGEAAQPVHFFQGVASIRFLVGRKAVRWQHWREQGLEVVKVRVARHQTVKNGQLVPFVSPLKPERPRLVFRGPEAELWGLLPDSLARADKGQLQLAIQYEEYHGKYDDEHIVDLNGEAHRYEGDHGLTAEQPLPLLFPALPADIETLLQRVSER